MYKNGNSASIRIRYFTTWKENLITKNFHWRIGWELLAPNVLAVFWLAHGQSCDLVISDVIISLQVKKHQDVSLYAFVLFWHTLVDALS